MVENIVGKKADGCEVVRKFYDLFEDREEMGLKPRGKRYLTPRPAAATPAAPSSGVLVAIL